MSRFCGLDVAVRRLHHAFVGRGSGAELDKALLSAIFSG